MKGQSEGRKWEGNESKKGELPQWMKHIVLVGNMGEIAVVKELWKIIQSLFLDNSLIEKGLGAVS